MKKRGIPAHPLTLAAATAVLLSQTACTKQDVPGQNQQPSPTASAGLNDRGQSAQGASDVTTSGGTRTGKESTGSEGMGNSGMGNKGTAPGVEPGKDPQD